MTPLIDMHGIVKTYNVGAENELEILHGIDLTVYPGGEHWFHTPEQMKVMGTWEERCLP